MAMQPIETATAAAESNTRREPAAGAEVHHYGVAKSSVEQLVDQARRRQPDAWAAMFNRYDSLVRSIARNFGLSSTDMDDISQMVWLKVFERITELREPRALPGWIAAITKNMCKEEVRLLDRTVAIGSISPVEAEPSVWPLANAGEEGAVDESMLREESRQAVRRGLAELSPRQQQLLLLLVADPPMPYAEVGRQLDLPHGSIGPYRARYLKRLRETEAIRSFVDSAAAPSVRVA